MDRCGGVVTYGREENKVKWLPNSKDLGLYLYFLDFGRDLGSNYLVENFELPNLGGYFT